MNDKIKVALIVSMVKLTSNHGQSLKTKNETLVFEDEDQGRKFIEENKNSVYHVQKSRLIYEK